MWDHPSIQFKLPNEECTNSESTACFDISKTQLLTVRQQEVLTLFSQGFSYQQIAQKLQIQSPKTVEKHLDLIRVRLAIKTRRECIQKAVEYGLL